MIDIIIPTCGGSHLEPCLQSMLSNIPIPPGTRQELAYLPPDILLIIVLNAEPAVNKRFHKLIGQIVDDCDQPGRRFHLVMPTFPTQVGFVNAVNAGFQHVSPGDYLVLANDDLTFHGDWLSPLLQALRTATLVGPSVKYVSPEALWGSPNDHYQYVEGWLLALRYPGRWPHLFDPIYSPGYCEDMELAIQIQEDGGSIQEVPLPVQHLRSQTFGKNRPWWTQNREHLIQKWNLVNGGRR